MPDAITRDAIKFEADFTSHFFGYSPEESLALEAMSLASDDATTNFDSYETSAWLRQYLPNNIIDRQRLSRELRRISASVHQDDASYQYYCYEYTQFSKNYRNNYDVNAD